MINQSNLIQVLFLQMLLALAIFCHSALAAPENSTPVRLNKANSVTISVDQPTLDSRRGISFIKNSPQDPSGETRLALVIGNSRYANVSQLINPQNDATDMAEALKLLGFEVIQLQNTTHQQMEQAVETFGQRLRQHQGVGLFYYAGHGVQVAGKNYLLPVDANISKASDIKFESMDAALVLKEMAYADNRLNMVILDACRDNPFAASFRTISRGLAQINAPSGTLLAYATAPGHVAADGDGRNGTYTKNLLAHLHSPGLKVEELFKKVRQDVIRQTNKLQVPWENSSLVGDFYFVSANKTNKANKANKPSKRNKTAPPEDGLCQQTEIDQRPIRCLFTKHSS